MDGTRQILPGLLKIHEEHHHAELDSHVDDFVLTSYSTSVISVLTQVHAAVFSLSKMLVIDLGMEFLIGGQSWLRENRVFVHGHTHLVYF